MISNWTERIINEMKIPCQNGKLEGSYGISDTNLLMTALRRLPVKSVCPRDWFREALD